MNEFLKTLLSLSLSGSLLILLLFLIKPMVRGRISKRWQYYIWLLVVARLLLPATPETSLVGSIFHINGGAVSADPARQTDGAFPPSNSGNAVDGWEGGVTGAEPEPLPGEVTGEPEPETEGFSLAALWERAEADALPYLWVVWLVAAAVLFIRKVTIYQSFCRYVTAGREEIEDMDRLEQLGRLVERMGIRRPVKLYTNRLLASPLLIGFFRPRIFLPVLPGGEEDFEAILLHELTHFKRRDMFYKWLVQLTVCLHWFNPLVYLAAREIDRACELSCDEAVIAALGEAHWHAYGDTLLKSMEATGAFHDRNASLALNENKKLLKERLEALAISGGKSRAAAVTALLLTVFLCAGATAAGAYTASSPVSTNAVQNKFNELQKAVEESQKQMDEAQKQLEKQEQAADELEENLSGGGQFGIDMTGGGGFVLNGDTGMSLADAKLVKTESWPVSGIREIAVDYDAGLVRVRPGSIKEIVLKEYHTLDDTAYHAEITAAGGKLEIKNGKLANAGSVSYLELYIPEGYAGAAKLNTFTAKVDVDSYNGALDCQTLSGMIAVSSSKINGTLESTSGTVKLDNCSGRLMLDSISGGIAVRNSNLSGTARATSGDIELQLSTLSGGIQAQSTSGNVTLYLPQEASFRLDAITTSGNLRNAFPGSFTTESHSVSGTAGNNPVYTLVLRTTSGAISVEQSRPSAGMDTASIAGTVYYLIDTEEQLRSIGANTYTLGLNYLMNHDVALTGEWEPIGTEAQPFTGYFDGNGCEISGLRVTAPGRRVYALFAYTEDAVVHNVALRNPVLGNDETMNKTVVPFVGIDLGGSQSYDNRIVKNDS